MKIQILFALVVATGALATYFTEVNPSAPSAAPGDIAVSTLPAPRIQPALRAKGNQEASTSPPEAAELRALLEHSLVTGRNTRAFMELFTRDESQFPEYIELILANADAPCEPSAQFSNRTCTAQSPKPESALEP